MIDIRNRRTGAIMLSAETFRGADLSGQDLREADFSGQDLRGASFAGANLTAAFMRAASFNDGSLSGAILPGADLRDTDLAGVDIRDAVVSATTDLRDAYVQTIVTRTANDLGAARRSAGGQRWPVTFVGGNSAGNRGT